MYYIPTQTITGLTYRLVIHQLPDSYRPAQVRRRQGVTLVAIDPRSMRREIAAWVVDNLTVEEMNLGREAYGQPPVGAPLEDEWMGYSAFPSEIPDSVRLAAPATALNIKETA